MSCFLQSFLTIVMQNYDKFVTVLGGGRTGIRRTPPLTGRYSGGKKRADDLQDTPNGSMAFWRRNHAAHFARPRRAFWHQKSPLQRAAGYGAGRDIYAAEFAEAVRRSK